ASGVQRREVVSPTFVLVHEYRGGRRPIIHIDAYRIRDEDEFAQLGPEEYFAAPHLTLIEWASRVAGCLPDEGLEVTISLAPQSDERRFELVGHGADSAAAIERLRKLL